VILETVGAIQETYNIWSWLLPLISGAIEVVAVLGENDTLHLVCLPFVLETDFHALPLQVGDKHVPVAISAGFRFEDVVQLIFRLVWLFLSIALYVLLAFSHVQTVFQSKFLADTGAAQPLVSAH